MACVIDLRYLRELFDTHGDHGSDTVARLLSLASVIPDQPGDAATGLCWDPRAMLTEHMAEIGLGTAQLGSKYGVSNELGQPDAQEVKAIVETALDAGVCIFDTAPAYGSEEALGDAIGEHSDARVITKTALSGDGAADAQVALDGFLRSLELLRSDRVAGLLVHHASDLLLPGGSELAHLLVSLRDDGRAEKIGFSVYEPAELERASEVLPPDIVQLPLNLFDQRFIRSGAIARLAAAGVEVHSRSAFLQGALLLDPSRLPEHLESARAALEQLVRIGADAGSRLAAPLAFCLQTPGVSAVIVGTNSAAELRQVLAARSAAVLEFDPERFALNNPLLIDPRRWP